MALTPKNWTLNSYTVSTWTDFVNEPSTLASIMMCNTTAGVVVVDVRLEDAGSSQAVMMNQYNLSANDTQVFDLRSLNITGSQSLQIQADTVGVEFIASGVV